MRKSREINPIFRPAECPAEHWHIWTIYESRRIHSLLVGPNDRWAEPKIGQNEGMVGRTIAERSKGAGKRRREHGDRGEQQRRKGNDEEIGKQMDLEEDGMLDCGESSRDGDKKGDGGAIIGQIMGRRKWTEDSDRDTDRTEPEADRRDDGGQRTREW